jgi:nucleoside-diphosphate-sugar epimerase
MDNNRTAVVTGGNGFVGSHLVDYLLEKGFKVKCIVRNTSDLRWLSNKPVEIYDCGLFDKKKLKEVLKDCDYLFHIAGVVKAKKPEGYYNGNVETTKNLLEIMAEVNPSIKRIVIVSSQTAGGPSLDGSPVTEDDIPNPITNYGKSKVAQEELAKSYMNNLAITICRPPAIFGERDTEIYLVFKTYAKGLMTLIGFNKKQVSLLHVKDLVRGLYLAAVKDKSNGETYYITSKEFYTWDQVGDVISSVMGKKALRIKIPHFIVFGIAAIVQFFALFSSKAATLNIEKARDFVQDYWICDPTKAERDLGYSQEVTIEEVIFFLLKSK